jgi:hypothetical protein
LYGWGWFENGVAIPRTFLTPYRLVGNNDLLTATPTKKILQIHSMDNHSQNKL